MKKRRLVCLCLTLLMILSACGVSGEETDSGGAPADTPEAGSADSSETEPEEETALDLTWLHGWWEVSTGGANGNINDFDTPMKLGFYEDGTMIYEGIYNTFYGNWYFYEEETLLECMLYDSYQEFLNSGNSYSSVYSISFLDDTTIELYNTFHDYANTYARNYEYDRPFGDDSLQVDPGPVEWVDVLTPDTSLNNWQDAINLPDFPEEIKYLLTHDYSAPAYTVEFAPGIVAKVYDDYYASCFVSWDVINEAFTAVDDPKLCYVNLKVNPHDPEQWSIRVEHKEDWLFYHDYPTSGSDSHEGIFINTDEGIYSFGYWEDGKNTKGQYGTTGGFWDPSFSSLQCELYTYPRENSFVDKVLWLDTRADKIR